MPGPYRVSFLINGLNRGFSESWFYNVTSAISLADQANIRQFAFARMRLCAAGFVCVAARVSDQSNPRSTMLLEIGNMAKADSNAEGPDVPSAAWLARCQTANGAKRQMWLRGGDDAWIKFDQATQSFRVDPLLQQAFTAFSQFLIPSAGQPAPPWCIGRIARVNAAGTDTKAAGTITTTPQNWPAIELDDIPWVPNTVLISSGWKKPWSFLNGTYTPNQWTNTTTQVVLQKPVTGTVILAASAGVRFRRRVVTMERLSSMVLVRAGGRRTGRAFFVPAGRRSSR
jgi:hypothetical protein